MFAEKKNNDAIVFRISHRRCFVKRSCSYKFRKFYGKTSVLDSLYNKVEGLRPEHLRGYFWGLTGSLETVNSSFKKNLKLMVKFKEVMALGSLKITFFLVFRKNLRETRVVEFYFNNVACLQSTFKDTPRLLFLKLAKWLYFTLFCVTLMILARPGF